MATPEQGQEPRLFFPALAPFYDWVREISWLIIRVTVGGMLLVHGINKLTGPGPTAFAKGLATRGIEPSLPFAYWIFFLETVGAGLIILGLFTRPVAAAIAIEFAVITFVAHWGNGFGWSNPRGGWEYPLLWGLMFFAVSLRGGGPYSLDRKIGKEV
jgi:putative oxidoreductase